jgi:hypothetical protein
MVTMFINAIDQAVIKRYNKDRVPEDQIKVRFVYSPKQRVLNDLLNKAQNLELPVVAVSIAGISRDVNRVFNKLQGSYFVGSDPRFSRNLSQPVPIDLAINVNILTRFQQDMDQILSNILPYCDPYFVISWRTESVPNQEIRSTVVWNGQANVTYPNDLNAGQSARVAADLSFTIKGWLFKTAPDQGDANIYTIISDYSSLSALTTQYALSALDENTERFIINGYPNPVYASPNFINLRTPKTINVYGDYFKRITNVYLSGNTLNGMSLQRPFSGAPTLSAEYVPFYGIKLNQESYRVSNENLISVSVPSLTAGGHLDIIVENQAGYSVLPNKIPIIVPVPYIQH